MPDKTLWKNGIIYAASGIIEGGELLVNENGTIEAVGPAGTLAGRARSVKDVRGLLILPGLIDVHVHGGGGCNMMKGTPEDLAGMSLFHAEHGTTSFLAATNTNAPEIIEQALRQVRDAAEQGGLPGADLLGAHLEGPFLNEKRAGAQKKEYLRFPDPGLIDRFVEASGGHIRLVTLAPELPGGMEAVERFAARGITVSIGHSDATFAEVREAVERGASHTTHHFNGMRPLHHREPGVAGAGLILPELTTELVLDGIHVHPDVVRLMFRTKREGNLCVITDAVTVAGLPDGDYGDVVMRNGEVMLPGSSTLAGSSLTMLRALKNAVAFTGLSLEQVLPCFTSIPAREAKAAGRKGTLEPGKDADFIAVNRDLQLFATVVKGKTVVNKGI